MTGCREYTGRWQNSLWRQPPTDSLEVVLRWRKAESEETLVTILPSNMELKIPTWAVKQTPIANKDFIQAIFAGDLGSIPGLGRSPGGGHGNPLQYSCLENPHGQPSRLQYMGSQRVGHDWGPKHSTAHLLLFFNFSSCLFSSFLVVDQLIFNVSFFFLMFYPVFPFLPSISYPCLSCRPEPRLLWHVCGC